MHRQLSIGVVCALALTANALAQDKGGQWITMFDGKSLKGWKVTKENPDSFKVENGAIVAHGERAHLFFEADKPFVNFEFTAEVMTTPGSNAGIYFHSKYQEQGWPTYGYEAQVNATHRDPKKTGSLYGVVDVNPAPHKDNEWFKYHIKVQGKRIIIAINDKTVVDYTEPADREAGNDFTRVLDKGTFALQGHDPQSKVLFRNLKVRRMPG